MRQKTDAMTVSDAFVGATEPNMTQWVKRPEGADYSIDGVLAFIPRGSVVVPRDRYERLRALAEAARDEMLLTTESDRGEAWLARNYDAFNRQWSAIKALQPGDLDPLPD